MINEQNQSHAAAQGRLPDPEVTDCEYPERHPEEQAGSTVVASKEPGGDRKRRGGRHAAFGPLAGNAGARANDDDPVQANKYESTRPDSTPSPPPGGMAQGQPSAACEAQGQDLSPHVADAELADDDDENRGAGDADKANDYGAGEADAGHERPADRHGEDLIVDPEFQALVGPLMPEEHAALEEELVRHGCQDAIKVWQRIIIDGHNRYDICRKHKLPFKTLEMTFASREEVAIWILETQVGRRNLSDDRRACSAVELAERKAALSRRERARKGGLARAAKTADAPSPVAEVLTEQVGDNSGVTDQPNHGVTNSAIDAAAEHSNGEHHPQIGDERNDIAGSWLAALPVGRTHEAASRPTASGREEEISRVIPGGAESRSSLAVDVTAEQQKNALYREPRQYEAAARQAGVSPAKVKALKKLKEKGPELFQDVRAGKITFLQARQQLRKTQQDKESQIVIVAHPHGEGIESGPPNMLADRLPNNSANLVATELKSDPQAANELATFAAAKLKAGGICLAVVAHDFIPQAIQALSSHLSYYWLLSTARPEVPVLGKKISSDWAPALLFRKQPFGEPSWEGMLPDSFPGPVSTADLIKKLTRPGTLVVDPMCGRGTLLVAAKAAGCNYLGAEIDEALAATARKNCAEITTEPVMQTDQSSKGEDTNNDDD